VVRSPPKSRPELSKRGTRLSVVGRAGRGFRSTWTMEAATKPASSRQRPRQQRDLAASEHTVAMIMASARAPIPQAHKALKEGPGTAASTARVKLMDRRWASTHHFGSRIGFLVAERRPAHRLEVVGLRSLRAGRALPRAGPGARRERGSHLPRGRLHSASTCRRTRRRSALSTTRPSPR